jgi:sporulation protein YlmC with PRC-barrel domain
VSGREIRLSRLMGRRVRDVNGRPVGRLHELVSEIALRPGGRDYVVREIHVRSVGVFDALAGSSFARHLFGRLPGVLRRYRVPWGLVDFADPDRPRLTCSREQLVEED